MKDYSVFLHINCAHGIFNDFYTVSAMNKGEAGTTAIRRVISELDGVTEVSVLDVTEE